MFNLQPSAILSRLVILLLALPVHELAHAWTAHAFGDRTPQRNGRLSLNPLAHLDPIGAAMLMLAGFGWAKPVPVNPITLSRRSPSANMLVALAGPLSNLLLAALAALPFRLGMISLRSSSGSLLPTPAEFLLYFILINLALMLFNLIPLFPLDGEKVLGYVLPARYSGWLDTLRPYGALILFGLIMLGRVSRIDPIGWLMGWPLSSLMRLLAGV